MCRSIEFKEISVGQRIWGGILSFLRTARGDGGGEWLGGGDVRAVVAPSARVRQWCAPGRRGRRRCRAVGLCHEPSNRTLS